MAMTDAAAAAAAALLPPGSDSGASDDGEWLDVEPDVEPVAVVSLLDSHTFATLDDMLGHCRQQHGFDLAANIRRLRLDFLGAVRLVNFIRRRVRQSQPLPDTISHTDIADDAYLKPVLDNDAVLFSLDDVLVSDPDEADSTTDERGSTALRARNRQLEAELESIRSSFANYRLAVQQTLDRRWGTDDSSGDGPEPGGGPEPGAASAKRRTADDSSYFDSYAAHDIHETMLKDQVRTDAYRDFIYGNKHLFKDKVILDIGCGTGILSMFCAKAGAARVLAVDKSDIIDKARENVFNNGLSDVVTCLRGAIEEVQLPVDKVDVIVSEWMGYCLLYEAMLPSVLFARDRYLKPGGLLVPSSATLWIAPVEDQAFVSEHVSYWRDVYGFDMKAMQEGIYDEVRVEAMPSSSLCGKPFPFRTLDLRHTRTEDLVFTAGWESDLNSGADSVDGFLIWFDNFFATSADEPAPEPQTTPEAWTDVKPGHVAFTTGPYGTETHWRQGLLLATLQPPPTEAPLPGRISGRISFSVPGDNARALVIETSWSVAGRERAQAWRLK